jgi:hypothetical protein
LRDNKPGGGSLWDSSNANGSATGSFVLSAGADAYLGGSHIFGGENSGATLEIKDGTFTLKKDSYALDGNATLTKPYLIDANDVLTVEGDSVLKVSGPTANLVLGSTAGTLDLAEEAKIAVDNGGTLTLNAGSGGHLKGTIEVGARGTLVEENTAGSLWNGRGDTGGYVLTAGAKAYLGGSTPTDLIIGGALDSAVLTLESGTLELKKEGRVELGGHVLLNDGTFPIHDGVIKSGATLEMVTGPVPKGHDTSAVKSKIEVKTGGTITFQRSADLNFYYNTGGNDKVPDLVPADTYTWHGPNDANTNYQSKWIGTLAKPTP